LKTFIALASSVAALSLPGCASNADSSAREWDRAQCNQVIDQEAREKCIERANSNYGVRSRDSDKAGKK
jgi:outer membrane lipoprotein SlyB